MNLNSFKRHARSAQEWPVAARSLRCASPGTGATLAPFARASGHRTMH